jgi:FixJ family two-component response regulator
MVTGAREEHPYPTGPAVYVLDGDPAVGESIRYLLRTLQLDVEVFTSAEEALPRIVDAPPLCLIAEVYLPGMTGIELQRWLGTQGLEFPVIMLATHADVPLAVEAMRLGAMDFIEKPTIDRVVLTRVKEAMALASRNRAQGNQEKPVHG